MNQETIMQEYRQQMAVLGFDTSDFTDDDLIEGARLLAEATAGLCVTIGESLEQAFIDLANDSRYTVEQVTEAFNQGAQL